MEKLSQRGAPDLGRLLRTQRTGRGLTIAALASKAGVAALTVSRWERGKAVPFIHELSRVLDVLGLGQAERHCYYACLEAPRAVRIAGAGASADLPVSSGELLRALRQRAGVPRSLVARAAGVSPNLVVQWEKGDCWPNPQHLQAFCFAVGATEDELIFLTTRTWRHLDPLPLDKDALEAVVDHLELHDTSATRAGTYLALAARYHDLYCAGKISEAEATSIYGTYGYYLGWRLGEFKEAGRVAASALASIARSRGPLRRGQREAVILQIEYGDKFQDARSDTDVERDFVNNLALLDGVADRLPLTRQGLYNDLVGTAWKKAGNLDQATRYFERSVALASSQEEVAQRRNRFATMLRRHGRFRQAALLLLPTPAGEKRVVVRVGNLLNHASVFVGLGGVAQAEQYLSQAIACLYAQGLDGYESEARTIAQAIEIGRPRTKTFS